jgi:hypothetical protein
MTPPPPRGASAVYFLINPGTEPIYRTLSKQVLVKHAESNMRVFVKDVRKQHGTRLGIERANRKWDGDGRYAFWILRLGRCPTCGRQYTDRGRVHPRRVLVLMPGLVLDQVRYMGKPQNIWHFPRLYVDGNSWVWCFAINAAGDLGCE